MSDKVQSDEKSILRVRKTKRAAKHHSAAIDAFLAAANALRELPLTNSAETQARENKLTQFYYATLHDAKMAQLEDKVEVLMDQIRQSLQIYRSWIGMGSAIPIYLHSKTHNHNPVERAHWLFEKASSELNFLAPQLRPMRPLTDLQQVIWDALKRRNLLAKEIASILGMPHLMETHVRQHIAAIKATGRVIKHAKGCGYYRSDAAPPSLAA